MKQSRWIAIGSILLSAALSVPAWATDPAHPGISQVDPARPGSLNYFEGQVSINGESLDLDPDAIGKTELMPGQSLETQTGKAELLLTPGVFFRLGDNSAVTMVLPNSTETELRLDKGEAIIEAAELHPQTDIIIDVGDARVRLAQTGLYDIDADQSVVRVYQGQFFVDANNREVAVKNQQQLAFDSDASMTPEKFSQDQAQAQAAAQAQDQDQAEAQDENQPQSQEDLYQWSSLRSSYLAEANVDTAQAYESGDETGDETANSSGDGWYWDPYYDAYTFIPPYGTTFYSPYGWGFYSPYDVGYAPFGFYGHEYHHFDHDYHHWDSGERHEAHYYDHFDHGAYRGPGSGYHDGHGAFVGRYPAGEVAGGDRMQPGQGFRGGEGYGGRGGEGFYGGREGRGADGYGARGGEGYGRGGEVIHGGEGSHGAGSSGGYQMGGAGIHSGGSSFGGFHGMGGGAHTGGGGAHGGGGGGHR